MKRTIAAISLVIALVMAGPVAAAGIDFGGSIETHIEVNRSVEGEVDVTPASELSLNLGFTAAQDKLRAGISSACLMVCSADTHRHFARDIALKQAFIEVTVHTGTAVLGNTRFGTLDIAWPYASVKNHSVSASAVWISTS